MKEKGLAKEDGTLVLLSVRPVAKDDSNGSYYTYSHKPMKPSKEDIECIEKLARDPDKENKLCERFRNIAYGWEIEFRKNQKTTSTCRTTTDVNEKDRLTSVYFKCIDPQSKQTVAVYRYESVSDGIRQIFHILLQFSDMSTYGNICLDESESYVHPRLYHALVCDIIAQTGWSESKTSNDTKLIFATHDFHLIDLLANIPEVNRVVFELNSTPIDEVPKTTKELLDYDHTKQAMGAKN